MTPLQHLPGRVIEEQEGYFAFNVSSGELQKRQGAALYETMERNRNGAGGKLRESYKFTDAEARAQTAGFAAFDKTNTGG